MSISEQVKELRIVAETYRQIGKVVSAEYLSKAADTIESLSAKLQAANEERSAADCGGWILCSSDNMPDMGSTVLIQFKSDMNGITGDDDRTFDISYMRSMDNSEWFCSTGKYPIKAVKAWKPIKSYHEP